MKLKVLQDNHGRSFSYLRLSLIDSCNFRCLYCLPDGYQRPACTGNDFEDSLLSPEEIQNLINALAGMGFKKVRLTGGEPTLRADILEIVARIANTPGIKTVALTTNGYRLDKLIKPLHELGLSALNLSLDSLNPENFSRITGSRNFERVYAGLERALEVGIPQVKLNVVLLKSYIEQDLPAFLELTQRSPITVRFIELMQTGNNGEFFRKEYYSGDFLAERLIQDGWKRRPRRPLDGPAVEFAREDSRGRLGVIAPYSKAFCTNCNRLRVSSRGKIKLCLFGDGELSLRHFMQSANQKEELQQLVARVVGEKPLAHRLHEGNFGSTPHLASIGG